MPKNKTVANSGLKLGTRRAEFTRAIVGAVLDAIVVTDRRGHILEFNPAAERMFGYRSEDVLRRDLADMLIPPSMREKHRRGIARYLAAGEGPLLGKRIEVTGMRADSSQMPLEPSITPIGLLPSAFVGLMRDVTEQKRMERELHQRESELAALFESSPDPHLRFDSNFRVTHANAAYVKISGVSAQAVIGKTGRELPLDQGDVQVATQLIKKVFQTSQPQRCEFSAQSPHGLTDHEVRYVPGLSSDGSVAAVLAIGRDITELKRIEQELRQRERELVELYDNSPDPIARRDRNLRILYANAAWEKVMGISQEKALGKTIEELGLPRASVKPQQRGGLEYEVRYIPELVNGKVASFLLIGRDVTEQKRLERLTAANERDIRALSASLITAQEQERRRVAREIHDALCQHLGALAADLGEVAARLPRSSPVRQHLQAARENAYRSAEEARQIAHQLHPAIVEDLGLATALQNLCDEFGRQQGIPIRFRLRKPLPAVPLEATSCAYRVAQEALNNVARHASAKRISVVLAVDRNLHLSIRDDGICFDPISVRGGRPRIDKYGRTRAHRWREVIYTRAPRPWNARGLGSTHSRSKP